MVANPDAFESRWLPSNQLVRHEKISWSQARFYHEAGYNHRTRMTQMWMEKSAIIRRIQNVTLSPKTSSYTEYEKYAKHMLTNLSDVMTLYGTTRFKRLQPWTYIRRQKAYEKIVQDLTDGNPENTVIGWGDACFESSMKGTKTVPTSILRRKV